MELSFPLYKKKVKEQYVLGLLGGLAVKILLAMQELQ